jgi:alcohol-forming fatty acyl-CoA reductase
LKSTKHPNTYTLSKALAEDVVHSFHQKLPIVIVRPSSVWYAVDEPFKGFIEGMNSGIAIICGSMTGLLRSMYIGENVQAKLTPVDFLINATIVSAWKKSTELDKLLIFNCTDAPENSLLWRRSLEIFKPYFVTYSPYEKLVWYPKLTITSSQAWHKVSMFLFQLLPAILYDTVQILTGRKPR